MAEGDAGGGGKCTKIVMLILICNLPVCGNNLYSVVFLLQKFTNYTRCRFRMHPPYNNKSIVFFAIRKMWL